MSKHYLIINGDSTRKENAPTFSEQLRAERARLGINQTQLSILLEVSFEAVSKWERGVSTPALVTQEGALARLKRHKAAPPQMSIAEFLKHHPQTKVVEEPGAVTAIQGMRPQKVTPPAPSE